MEEESNSLQRALSDLKNNFGAIEQKFVENTEKKKMNEYNKHKETLEFLKKVSLMIETETSKRVEQERYFANLIDRRGKELLNKYTLFQHPNMPKSKDPCIANLMKYQK